MLYYSLAKLRGKQNIYFVNANLILAGALDADTDLSVKPSGASRYKSAKLNAAGLAAINPYVADGGRCAGAYSACQATHWTHGRPYEILTSDELAFFPGLAEWPPELFTKAHNY